MSTKLFNYINIIKTYIIKDYLMGILSAIILENEGFSLNDMTLLQRLMLKKVYIGKLNYDHISDKETKILDELVDFGLLDIGYEITPDGEHAAKLLNIPKKNVKIYQSLNKLLRLKQMYTIKKILIMIMMIIHLQKMKKLLCKQRD
jgi:hypothetical protein